jgi:hypothetical protein
MVSGLLEIMLFLAAVSGVRYRREAKRGRNTAWIVATEVGGVGQGRGGAFA